MTLQIVDCTQGEPDWYEARKGLPTASEFSTVLAEAKAVGHLPQNIMDAMVKSGVSAAQLAAAVKAAKKKYSGGSATRKEYMRKLAGEVITSDPMYTYQNDHMDRGKTAEDEAREHYCFAHEAEAQRVGFIKNFGAGASPDSLIGDSGGLEIKSALAHIQIERLEKGTMPPEHVPQVQGNLWIAEREWWDFASYCPKLPLLVVRVTRDEAYIKQLAEAVDQFNEELAALVEKIRRYGLRDAA